MPTEQVVATVNGTEEVNAGLPKPTFTEPSAGGSTSNALSPEQLTAISQALAPIIETTIERKLQSTKDKRFSKLEQGESVMRDVLATLKEQGVALPPAIEQQFQIQDAVDQALKLRGVAPQVPSGNGTNGAGNEGEQFNVVEELTKLGLSGNDATVLDMLRKQYRNTDHLRAELASYALKTKSSTASATVSTPLSGGATNAGEIKDNEREALSTEYMQLSTSPTRNGKRMKEIAKTLGW